jgi:hypothetical protein
MHRYATRLRKLRFAGLCYLLAEMTARIKRGRTAHPIAITAMLLPGRIRLYLISPTTPEFRRPPPPRFGV